MLEGLSQIEGETVGAARTFSPDNGKDISATKMRMKRIVEITVLAQKIRIDAQETADRLFGANPSENGQAGESNQPFGELEELDRAIAELEGAVADLGGVTARFRGL